MMSIRIAGLFIGLLLGIVWMWLGFGAALLAGGLALLGWLIGSILEGKTDIAAIWDILQGRRDVT